MVTLVSIMSIMMMLSITYYCTVQYDCTFAATVLNENCTQSSIVARNVGADAKSCLGIDINKDEVSGVAGRSAVQLTHRPL